MKKIEFGNAEADAPKWWYNLKTNRVEHGLLSAALYRAGPFETKELAEKALDTLRERSAKWSSEDEVDRG